MHTCTFNETVDLLLKSLISPCICVTRKHFAGAGELVAVTLYYTQPANHTANAFSFSLFIEFDVSLWTHLIIIINIQLNMKLCIAVRIAYTRPGRKKHINSWFISENCEFQWLFIESISLLLPFAKFKPKYSVGIFFSCLMSMKNSNQIEYEK